MEVGDFSLGLPCSWPDRLLVDTGRPLPRVLPPVTLGDWSRADPAVSCLVSKAGVLTREVERGRPLPLLTVASESMEAVSMLSASVDSLSLETLGVSFLCDVAGELDTDLPGLALPPTDLADHGDLELLDLDLDDF
mgnify:CR=1 FL=1